MSAEGAHSLTPDEKAAIVFEFIEWRRAFSGGGAVEEDLEAWTSTLVAEQLRDGLAELATALEHTEWGSAASDLARVADGFVR